MNSYILMVGDKYLHGGFILFHIPNDDELYIFDTYREAKEFADGLDFQVSICKY